MNIHYDTIIVERKQANVIVNKMEKTAIIIDASIPGDKRINNKEREKIKKYQNLKREVQRPWNLKKIDVIPVALLALGSVTMNFEKYVDKIGIKKDLHTAQNIIRDSKNIKKVLEC